MDVEEATSTEITRRLDQLQDEYGPFAVYEKTVENEPDFFEHGKEMADEDWIGDAGGRSPMATTGCCSLRVPSRTLRLRVRAPERILSDLGTYESQTTETELPSGAIPGY